MKVLLVNGSSNMAGSTFTALSEVARILNDEGIDTEIFQLGSAPISDCTACGACGILKRNRCVIKDDCINELIEKAEAADGFVFGTPVYYAHPSGRLLSALDRAFYAGGSVFAHKPGFAIAVARRAGTTAALDAVLKHLTINQMPVISSTYWSMVHGANAADVPKDAEGMQTMRNAARNMAWLLKCIEAGKAAGIHAPKAERGSWTNFIR